MFVNIILILNILILSSASKKIEKEYKKLDRINIIKNEFILVINDTLDDELIINQKINEDFKVSCKDFNIEKIMFNLYTLKYNCTNIEVSIEELNRLSLTYIESIEHNKKVSSF